MSMEPTEFDHRLRVAEAVVREAGRLAADHFARRELLHIDRKGTQDLVSDADRACEDLIVAGLAELFPQDDFLGEERGSAGLVLVRAAGGWINDFLAGDGLKAAAKSVTGGPEQEEVALGCAGPDVG